jgi:hypothetical protein
MKLNNMDINQVLNKRMEEVYISTPFECQLPSMWYDAAERALRFSSPIQLGIMGPEMYTLEQKVKAKEQVTMYEFACLNTLLERTSREQFSFCSDNDYWDLLAHTAKYAEVWNRWGEAIQKQIQEKLMAERAEELKRRGQMAQA